MRLLAQFRLEMMVSWIREGVKNGWVLGIF